MKHITKILPFPGLLILIGMAVHGQANDCDTIYTYVEIAPSYKDGQSTLYEDITKEVVSTLSECIKRDKTLATKIQLILTINKIGQVIDIDFERIEATMQCKEELRNKIVTMTGWSPGRIQGEPVCCRYPILISCINWN